jgi:hypothetical protein
MHETGRAWRAQARCSASRPGTHHTWAASRGHTAWARARPVRIKNAGQGPPGLRHVSAILARTSSATAASPATRPVSWGHQASDTEHGVRSRIGTKVTPGRLYQRPTAERPETLNRELRDLLGC